jgi:hypothetical protein
MTAEQLAAATGTHAPSLYRLLRALACNGVFCHRAMSPTSRLLIIETVLSEGNAFHPGKMLDITMLTLTPGRERSGPEYRALLDKARFTLTRVIPTNSAVSIVEATPV